MRNRSERFSSRTGALQFSLAAVLFSLCLASLLRAQETEPNMPMGAHSVDAAEFRWLHKKILDSRVLDSMEDLSSWSFAGVGEMTQTIDRAKDGKYALRIQSTTNVARAGGDEEWEDLVASRKFANENWSRFNRISTWVYPDVVGAPAVSDTRSMDDAPYWPTQICRTYKEVWTQPVGRWIWLLQDIAVPATVRGIVAPSNHQPVEFREQGSGQVVTTIPSPIDGAFSLHLPEGRYDVRQGSVHTNLMVLPGGYDSIDLRPEHFLDFTVSFQDFGQNEFLVRGSAEGAGPYVFSIRSDNLAGREQAALKVDLTAGNVQQAVWRAHVLSANTPSVTVVIPDDALAERRGVTGAETRH